MHDITIFVAGDVLNYHNGAGNICSPSLENIVSAATYSVCNFEAPISGVGKPQPKSGTHHCQRFATLAGLRRQGFDLVLLANNHIMDFGEHGLGATIQAALDAGLDTIGAGLDTDAAYTPLIKNLGGLRIGLINACEAQFGVLDYFARTSKAGYAWVNHHIIDRNVNALRKHCDFILVFVHAGLEYYSVPQIEWRERYKGLCDLGADVVIGAHPHVPQGCERYGESLIFYSLGNFYFDSRHRDLAGSSYSILLTLSRSTGISFAPISHYKHDGMVRLAPSSKQIDLESLSHLLDEGYKQSHEAMSLEAYKRIKTHWRFVTNPFPLDRGPVTALKAMANRFLGRNVQTDKELLQLHLLRNEAYYFAARHALELKVRETYG